MNRTIRNYHVNVVANSDQSHFISSNDKEMDKRAQSAVKSVIDKAKVCNKPIAKYDLKMKKAYIEYSDGRRIYVD